MVKLPLQYKDAFRRGLRSTKEPRNQDRLSQCYNAKPQAEGLLGWTEIPQVVSQDSVDFPFPQVFVGREMILIAYEDSIKEYNALTGEETEFNLFSYTDGTTPATITSNDLWHWVDLGKLFYMTNGISTVFRDNTNYDYENPSVVKVCSDVVFGTLCAWRGRMIAGGIKPRHAWRPAWKTLLEGYRENERLLDELKAMSYDLDESWVIHSTVGTSDLIRWLMYPDEATSGEVVVGGVSIDAYLDGRSPLQHALLRNELGFYKMPFPGKVLRVMPHMLGYVVYCEEGIALMEHEASISNFGMKILSEEVGIMSRGAVGGSEKRHCFVDTTGTLCMINSKGELNSLGYDEFFKPMKRTDIVVDFKDDPEDPEFYISNADRGFTLTTQGLGEQFQSITSVGMFYGEVGCVSKNHKNKGMLVETSDYEGGIRSQKVVSVARVSSNRTSGVHVRTRLGYSSKTGSILTRPRMLNPHGNVVLGDTAVDCNIIISSDEPQGLLVEQMDVEIANIDKRFVRGAYGQEADQRADS